ncbi:unnamed protein product (macronuclear) [Paramecium tetraurelia]|uniref:Uncharacterized protein n=1 Tax=Paramecium tetraurelia TaxID=5888 RepID=A0C753_PARTE|nr:uncharacterized protein GSPATT00035750001 [Paramecium tetraurelia]CAK66620.1 unnamed protein product [Paramecium tetraurelia]|eukprot:XP_001434017.1 hypothetical protein (macronuclear) [Paramecium tetraurelia strain d4-2]
MTTLNVQINLNQFQLILQKEEEKKQQQYSLQRKEYPKGPINLYESRFEKVSLSNQKINEVIGWMLIIAVILMILVLPISIIQNSIIGFAIPLLSVTTFFIVYINWISMKFFINS